MDAVGSQGVRLQFKQLAKRAFQAHPRLWAVYWGTKQQIIRLLHLRFFAYDIANTYRSMYWPAERNRAYHSLSAELLFQYHKLEKGYVMPGEKRVFGADVVERVVQLVRRWESSGHQRDDPIYLGAIETLRAYRCHIALVGGGVPTTEALRLIDSVLVGHERVCDALVTPTPLRADTLSPPNLSQFRDLAMLRRSVRTFAERPVDRKLIEDAVSVAQLSPSVCNRQACGVHVFTQVDRVRELLANQNGNRGFGHQVPVVVAVVVDETCFVNATERHQPYVDGGLFTMSFLLALSAAGLSSCCLNWCAAPAVDKLVHRNFSIPDTKRIVTLIAVGYAAPNSVVPRSARRQLQTVIRWDELSSPAEAKQ